MFKEASLTAALVQEERFIDSESEDKCVNLEIIQMLIQIKVIDSVHWVLDEDLNLDLDLFPEQAVKQIHVVFCWFFSWFPYFKTPSKIKKRYNRIHKVLYKPLL